MRKKKKKGRPKRRRAQQATRSLALVVQSEHALVWALRLLALFVERGTIGEYCRIDLFNVPLIPLHDEGVRAAMSVSRPAECVPIRFRYNKRGSQTCLIVGGTFRLQTNRFDRPCLALRSSDMVAVHRAICSALSARHSTHFQPDAKMVPLDPGAVKPGAVARTLRKVQGQCCLVRIIATPVETNGSVTVKFIADALLSPIHLELRKRRTDCAMG